jgi:hypothetical protein
MTIWNCEQRFQRTTPRNNYARSTLDLLENYSSDTGANRSAEPVEMTGTGEKRDRLNNLKRTGSQKPTLQLEESHTETAGPGRQNHDGAR